jgi:hypothetical protein
VTPTYFNPELELFLSKEKEVWHDESVPDGLK